MQTPSLPAIRALRPASKKDVSLVRNGHWNQTMSGDTGATQIGREPSRPTAVQLSLGRTKMDSTFRYLGVEL